MHCAAGVIRSAQSIVGMAAQHGFSRVLRYLATNLCADTETPFYNAAIDRDAKAVTTFLAAGVKPSFFPSGAEFEFVKTLQM